MPCTVNPIRVALLKKNLLAGQSQPEAMLNAGFAKSTSLARLADNKSLKIAKAEITAEIDKRGLANRAYNTLDDNLTAPERPVQVAAAATILRFADNDSRFKIDSLPEAEKMEFEALRQKVLVNITIQSND